MLIKSNEMYWINVHIIIVYSGYYEKYIIRSNV